MPVAAHRPGAAGSMSDLQALARLRRAAPAAVNSAIAAALLVAAGIAVELEGSVAGAAWERLGEVGLGLACATCAALGALIVASIPRQRLGLALLVGGFLGALWMLATPLAEGYPDHSGPIEQWAAWVENWAFVGLIVLVTWPLLLFPDGHLPSHRWRPVGAALLVAPVAIALNGMLDPGTLGSVDAARPVANPLGIPAAWTWVDALGAGGVVIPLGVTASMIAVQRRAAGRAVGGARVGGQLRAVGPPLLDRHGARGRDAVRRDVHDIDRGLRARRGGRGAAPPRARGRRPAQALVHRGRGRRRHLHGVRGRVRDRGDAGRRRSRRRGRRVRRRADRRPGRRAGPRPRGADALRPPGRLDRRRPA
jgi:hypothetical protein